MKSQNGVGLLQLVLIVVVLMLILGATTYVVFQKNGVLHQEEQKYLNSLNENTIVEK